ncbi:hypothetical protein B0H13DRAFT_1912973 [Mycena leptocephala]|nr:hypothetical protein B0H13DRAFT_1912973 [Mycena leptocephala]
MARYYTGLARVPRVGCLIYVVVPRRSPDGKGLSMLYLPVGDSGSLESTTIRVDDDGFGVERNSLKKGTPAVAGFTSSGKCVETYFGNPSSILVFTAFTMKNQARTWILEQKKFVEDLAFKNNKDCGHTRALQAPIVDVVAGWSQIRNKGVLRRTWTPRLGGGRAVNGDIKMIFLVLELEVHDRNGIRLLAPLYGVLQESNPKFGVSPVDGKKEARLAETKYLMWKQGRPHQEFTDRELHRSTTIGKQITVEPKDADMEQEYQSGETTGAIVPTFWRSVTAGAEAQCDPEYISLSLDSNVLISEQYLELKYLETMGANVEAGITSAGRPKMTMIPTVEVSCRHRI